MSIKTVEALFFSPHENPREHFGTPQHLTISCFGKMTTPECSEKPSKYNTVTIMIIAKNPPKLVKPKISTIKVEELSVLTVYDVIIFLKCLF